MYLFIHHEFLLFKNKKQRAEERGDKVEKNKRDGHPSTLFKQQKLRKTKEMRVKTTREKICEKKSFRTKNTIRIHSKNRVNTQCFHELF
jgi:hypothetical protein